MGYSQQILKAVSRYGYYATNLFGEKKPISQCNYEFMEKLSMLPQECLEKIWDNIEIFEQGCQAPIEHFWDVAAQHGYISFEPTLWNIGDSPVLALKYNRFVVYKDGNFKVTYDHNGIGSYQAANVNFTTMSAGLEDSFALRCLFYMLFYNACYGLDKFDKAFIRHTNTLDNFVYECAKEEFSKYNVTYSDLKSLLSLPEECEYKAVFRVPKSETMDLCRIYVSSAVDVSIEFMQNGSFKHYRIKLPTEDVKYAKNPYVLKALVSFVLNIAGFVVNKITVYPLDKEQQAIKALNSASVKQLWNIDSLMEVYL